MAAACKEPAPAMMPKLLAGMSDKIKAIKAAVKRNEWEKHAKTCEEGVGCLSWYL